MAVAGVAENTVSPVGPASANDDVPHSTRVNEPRLSATGEGGGGAAGAGLAAAVVASCSWILRDGRGAIGAGVAAGARLLGAGRGETGTGRGGSAASAGRTPGVFSARPPAAPVRTNGRGAVTGSPGGDPGSPGSAARASSFPAAGGGLGTGAGGPAGRSLAGCCLTGSRPPSSRPARAAARKRSSSRMPLRDGSRPGRMRPPSPYRLCRRESPTLYQRGTRPGAAGSAFIRWIPGNVRRNEARARWEAGARGRSSIIARRGSRRPCAGARRDGPGDGYECVFIPTS